MRYKQQQYEVIKADSSEEAVKKSKWSIGLLARCVEILPVANSDGTWSVFSVFDVVEAEAVESNFLAPPIVEEDDCA